MHLFPLTWLPSQVEGRLCAGCRRLAGPHCVVSFRVHVELEDVFPFGNLKRNQSQSVLLPHLENESTTTGQCWSTAKLGWSEALVWCLRTAWGQESLPPNLPRGTAAAHKAGRFPAQQSYPPPAGAVIPTPERPQCKNLSTHPMANALKAEPRQVGLLLSHLAPLQALNTLHQPAPN